MLLSTRLDAYLSCVDFQYSSRFVGPELYFTKFTPPQNGSLRWRNELLATAKRNALRSDEVRVGPEEAEGDRCGRARVRRCERQYRLLPPVKAKSVPVGVDGNAVGPLIPALIVVSVLNYGGV